MRAKCGILGLYCERFLDKLLKYSETMKLFKWLSIAFVQYDTVCKLLLLILLLMVPMMHVCFKMIIVANTK